MTIADCVWPKVGRQHKFVRKTYAFFVQRLLHSIYTANNTILAVSV